MTAVDPGRRPTRATVPQDLPAFDPGTLDERIRDALAGLLLSMADDEFVLGFIDSEWTGIAPMLEEDVAFSSLAQDEIGHARVLYEMLARLTGGDADEIAFGRPPQAYRHCRLLDHPRTDWALSIARRWLYDTADAVRLGALRSSTFRPLAEVVAKIRREETYHLMHMDVWMRRLAAGGEEPRRRLEQALGRLWPDAATVFAPQPGEEVLVRVGILATPMSRLAGQHLDLASAALAAMGVPTPDATPSAEGGRERSEPSEAFRWLWSQFTMVRRTEEHGTW